MDLGLRDRVAIVTGSSRGIGKAIAYGLAKEGVKVAICARNEDSLQTAAEEIKASTKADILSIRADLTSVRDIKTLVFKTVEEYERVDILINNAGGPPSSCFLETSREEWKNAVTSLLMSIIVCCKEIIPYIKEHKWGRIINMTSFAAKQPAERLVLSNTIRAGVLGLTKTLSNELAEYGILVNAVCPGWALTRRIKELAQRIADQTGRAHQKVLAEWARRIPLNRLAQPEEIADLVIFLASERASYLTGAVIQVDGGFIKSLL